MTLEDTEPIGVQSKEVREVIARDVAQQKKKIKNLNVKLDKKVLLEKKD